MDIKNPQQSPKLGHNNLLDSRVDPSRIHRYSQTGPEMPVLDFRDWKRTDVECPQRLVACLGGDGQWNLSEVELSGGSWVSGGELLKGTI